MLTRRLLFGSPLASRHLRTLTTSSAHQRSPALGDIQPNGAAQFDARQSKFRHEVREAYKVKQKQDSQSSAAASTAPTAPYNAIPGVAPTAQPASDASTASSNNLGNVALGSLSTHDAGAERESSQKHESSKRKGALSSLIYGTQEGQQMDKEIEKSFSQVLARGKYVHSIVFHSVKPDKVDEYVDLVGGWYPKVAGTQEHHVNLVGSWRTEVGDCDTFGIPFFIFRFRRALLIRCDSPYMGVSTLPRLPFLSSLHPETSQFPRFRPQAQITHNPEAHLTHARILFLAYHPSAPTRRSL